MWPVRKILVAVDGSEGSMMALEAAIGLAEAADAQLTVLQVVEEDGPLPTYDDQAPPNVDRLTYLADRSFGPVRQALEKSGQTWNRRIEEGGVPDQICRVAEEEVSDVVVVGSRGLSVAGRLFLGSVSDRVIRAAPCSVVVAR